MYILPSLSKNDCPKKKKKVVAHPLQEEAPIGSEILSYVYFFLKIYFFVFLGCYYGPFLLASSFFPGGDGLKGVDRGYCYISQLE